jgi:hypothetical protein
MKKIALRTLIGSIALSALLGIVAILGGDFGELQVKVLFTALTVSGASILVMACGAAWERGVLRHIPKSGAIAAVASGVLVTIGLWGEVRSEEYWKLVGTVSIAAGALAHASLVALAELAIRFRWSRLAAYGLAAILSLTMIVLVWAEGSDSEGVFRFIAVVSILLASATIAIPVFHRMSRLDGAEQDSVARFCPKCGAVLSQPTECSGCHARFRVDWLA